MNGAVTRRSFLQRMTLVTLALATWKPTAASADYINCRVTVFCGRRTLGTFTNLKDALDALPDQITEHYELHCSEDLK